MVVQHNCYSAAAKPNQTDPKFILYYNPMTSTFISSIQIIIDRSKQEDIATNHYRTYKLSLIKSSLSRFIGEINHPSLRLRKVSNQKYKFLNESKIV